MTLNNKLKFTLENPKSPFVEQYQPLNKYPRILTSYCKYGYYYKKPTYFWYYNYQLKLKPICRDTKDKDNWCRSKRTNKYGNCHRVQLGLYKGKIDETTQNFKKQYARNYS